MTVQLEETPERSTSERRSEADHCVANHLAILAGLLRMQGDQVRKDAGPLSGGDAALILAEFEIRLEIIAILHRQLARQPEGAPVDVAEYVRSVAAAIVSCLPARDAIKVRYEFLVRCFLPAGKAAAVGLVIGEMVANAVKYAHPTGVGGEIDIKAAMDGATLLFEVADDGVGLPEGFDPQTSPSFGFRMMRGLAAQLGGKLHFENHGLGLRCALEISRAAPSLRVVS